MEFIDAAVKYVPLFTAMCLVVSIVVALYQIRRTRQIQSRLKAQDLWSTYLQQAMEYPVLAYPPGHSSRFDYKDRTIRNEAGDESEVEFERYEWFLSFLLKTARQILQEFGDDPWWVGTIRRNLRYHRQYLTERRNQRKPDDFIALSGPQVSALIEEIARENP